MSVRRCVPLLAAGLFGCGPLGISESPRKTDSERSGRADSGQTPPSLKSDKTQQSGNDSGSGDTNSGAAGSGAGGTQGQADAPQQGNNDAGPRAKFSELKASALSFTLPARNFETPANYLWATYYYTPRFSHLADGYELRDLNEVPLGPKLSHRQWCDSAMEGSVQVLMNGTWKTYNYAGTSSSVQVDCSRYFKHPVGRTRFKPARGPIGDGVGQYILSPYRTVAVDPNVIPYGTVIYIDAARGLPFALPDGSQRIHDGYFFAADTGGLIRGNHIDVFIGIDTVSPFSWITSNSDSRIQYQIVPDKDLMDVLRDIHL